MGLFGGGNSTSSNLTTNNDNRQVNTSTSNSYDLSDNSIKNTSSSYDLSDHSVNNSVTTVTDGGAIQQMGAIALSAINGGVQALLGTGAQVQSGYDYADHIFDTATSFANAASTRAAGAFDAASQMEHDSLTGATQAYSDAMRSVGTAYGAASQAQADALKSTASAYGVASQAQAQAQAATAAAYADAKGTTDSQKQIILGVLAVAGLMALAVMQRKA